MTQILGTVTPYAVPEEGETTLTDTAERATVRAVQWANFGKGVPTLERLADDGFKPALPLAMTRSRRASLRALIRLICPNEVPMPDMEERIELQVRRSMAYMPWIAAFGLSFCFALLDWSPRFLLRSTRRLRRMNRDRAEQLIGELSESSITLLRTVMYATKGIIMNAYFDQDEVHRALNYAPTPFMRERISLRQRLLAGQLAHPADEIPSYPLPHEEENGRTSTAAFVTANAGGEV
ncbi:MAG: hypothetical protein KGO50_12495 [Myxococcales bacterium]|nr:hypothetical protein [Myxococcales bacterium]